MDEMPRVRMDLGTLLIKSAPFTCGLALFAFGAGQYIYFLITGRCVVDKNGDAYADPVAHARETAVMLFALGAVGGISALYGFFKSQRLVKNGVVVVGTIHIVSGLLVRGMKDISYSYVVDGVIYESKTSVPAADHKPLDPIRLLVDSTNPKTHIVL